MKCFADLDETTKVSLRFSYGLCLVDGKTDYQELLKRADEAMYRNKAERKMNTARWTVTDCSILSILLKQIR